MAGTGFPGDLPADADPQPTPGVAPEAKQNWNEWKSRITASRDYIKSTIREGQKNVNRQRQKFFAAQSSVDRMAAPDDFFLSQQKIAQLFYKVPEVQLSAKRPGPDEQAAPLFQAVLNEMLGPDNINVKSAMDEALTDLITAVGYGAFKIGYDATLDDVPQTDPITGDPMSHPVTGELLTQKVLVHEAYRCSHIPPGRMLFQPEFIGSDYDKAGYIGFRFIEDVPPGTPNARTTRLQDDEELLSRPPTESSSSTRTYLIVDAIWFKAALFMDDVKDPEEIWQLEWVQDAPEPRVFEACPYQKFPGFPVKVLTTRYVSDSALPPSDTTITRNLVDAKSIGLTQQLLHRERTLPQNLIDTSRVGPDELAKIEANVQDSFIGMPMPITPDLCAPLMKGALPQETYVLENSIDAMIEKAWSMGANQVGRQTRGSHTATELQIIQTNMDTRLGYEQDKVTVFFLTKLVRCIAALIQQYAPQDGGYVRVLGANGAQALQQWTGTQIQGDFAFSIKINSQLRPDSVADMQRISNWINFSARSPFINQQTNWKLAAEAFGFDPTQLIVQPPPPQPEPPKIALTFTGADLDPAAPQYANVAQILEVQGIKLPPTPSPVMLPGGSSAPQGSPGQGAPALPVNHLTPGTAHEAPVLTKHMDTGKLPGGGAMVHDAVGGKVM